MHTLGKVCGCEYGVDGSLIVKFEVTDKAKVLDELQPLDGELLDIDAKKHREKRSLDANAYFWKLCTMIADVLDSDKWTIYLMKLQDYGVSYRVNIPSSALQSVRKLTRFSQIVDEWGTGNGKWYSVLVYPGESTYNTDEMSKLIKGTVADAKELGLETLTPRELAEMLGGSK